MVDDNRQHFNVSREALGLPTDQTGTKPKTKVEKIVEGQVVQKKKPAAQKVAETFFGGDLKEVATYTVKSVLIPAAKNMFFDTVTEGLKRLMWGESSSTTTVGRTDYGSRYRRYRGTSGGIQTSRPLSPVTNSSITVDDAVLTREEDARNVLTYMYDLLDQYNEVTLAQFYDLLGITGDFTAEQWGWRSLQGAHVQQIHDGWRIVMPRLEQL